MSWSSVTLSTIDTIARLEANINSLTDTTWESKISVAKDLIRDEIYLHIPKPSDIDNLDNTEVFELPSDYLTLHLIFEDISKGSVSGSSITKRDTYLQLYTDKMRTALTIINKYDNDSGEIDYAWTTGSLSR